MRENVKSSLKHGGMIALVQCAIISGAFFVQGCGTTMAPVELPKEPRPMPPPANVKPAPAKPGCTAGVKPAGGNVVKPVPSKTPPVKTWDVGETTTYKVVKGDTLSQIAARYKLSVSEILSLNKLASANKIFVGQELMLPGKIDISKPVKRTTRHSTSVSKPIPSGSSVYVVKKGDCLSKIAARAGVTTKSLREVNGLKSDVIFVGKKLIIPPGGKIETVPAAAPAPEKNTVNEDKPSSSEDKVPAVNDAFSLPNLEPEQPVLTPPAAGGNEPAAPSGGAQYYTVKEGDNILTVASEFNISIASLRAANKLTSDILTPGQRLLIPTAE
jgi:LysM repeat protein